MFAGKVASLWQLWWRGRNQELGIGFGREFGPLATLGVTDGGRGDREGLGDNQEALGLGSRTF